MKYEKISLFPDKPWVTLEFIGNELPGAPRDAMLVIPGGAYWCVCADREGYPIAAAYYLQGMQTFVLTYSTNKQITHYTQPLEEAAAAMLYIRNNAEKYNLSGKVYAAGFSAGGHLTGWLGTCRNNSAVKALYGADASLCRPDGVVLCYPVIHEFREKVKEDSFNFLYSGKDELTREELDTVELDRFVNKDSAPAFIIHTFDDQRVPVENALVMAEAYRKADVPFEMHIYPHAPHGLALGNDVTSINNPGYEDPQIARWVADSRSWMKKYT